MEDTLLNIYENDQIWSKKELFLMKPFVCDSCWYSL